VNLPADNVTNLFVHCSAAQRYAAARPYFHPRVIQRIASFTGLNSVDRAIDIACGTGQSARALTAIARSVEGVDISAEMLSQSIPHPAIHYYVAPAEHLPFAPSAFDLATVGLAFHWFDQRAFLAEAHRVLKPAGWLIIYTSGFAGEMAENPGFRQWAWEVHPRRFPTPPRRSLGVTAELVQPHGFSLAGTENFAHEETMTARQLTAYLLTQTNVIAHVESGGISLAQATDWIEAGVAPFFAGKSATMKFSGSIWFLYRIS